MLFFKRKEKELDNKSIHIAVMYLSKAKTRLEKELDTGERSGENEVFTAKHDIRCLERAINYLNKQ